MGQYTRLHIRRGVLAGIIGTLPRKTGAKVRIAAGVLEETDSTDRKATRSV